MNYVLITPSGDKHYFYLEECAKIFQHIFGGAIVRTQALEESRNKYKQWSL